MKRASEKINQASKRPFWAQCSHLLPCDNGCFWVFNGGIQKRYKDQYPQRKLLYAFVKKCQNLTFKVNFQVYQNVKNHLDFSDFFFHLQFRITLLEEQFLKTSIFGMFHLLRWCPIFDDSSLYQITKYNFSLYTSLENFLKSSIRIQSEFSYLQKKNYTVYL